MSLRAICKVMAWKSECLGFFNKALSKAAATLQKEVLQSFLDVF